MEYKTLTEDLEKAADKLEDGYYEITMHKWMCVTYEDGEESFQDQLKLELFFLCELERDHYDMQLAFKDGTVYIKFKKKEKQNE